jgi:hypothetical protein
MTIALDPHDLATGPPEPGPGRLHPTKPKCLVGFRRNRWSDSTETGDRFHPKSAFESRLPLSIGDRCGWWREDNEPRSISPAMV